MLTLLNSQIAYIDRGHSGFQSLPFLSAIQGDKHTPFGSGKKNFRLDMILFERIDRTIR
jgi:hypothetical protein